MVAYSADYYLGRGKHAAGVSPESTQVSIVLSCQAFMNVDHILQTLNHQEVDFILIGGMNFLLRHAPELTFDVDIWVADASENLMRLNEALKKLGAKWGPTEQAWGPVPDDFRWLETQSCFCLETEHGALDIFREVCGLEGGYLECRKVAVFAHTPAGIAYAGLSDAHMLATQEALPASEQKPRRIATLKQAIQRQKNAPSSIHFP